MLKQLNINGLAVVKELSLEFEPGLNVLTGETGAGKSIIVGAIGLVMAEKAGQEVVRTGEKSAKVTAVFDVKCEQQAAGEIGAAGIDLDSDEMIVRREISSEGRTRTHINGEPVSLNVLKKVGDLLVDFHGQHEHQSLLKKNTHVDLLDSFGGLHCLREKVWQGSQDLRNLRVELDHLLTERRELQAQIDFVKFQVGDIDTAQLKEGEEDALEEERGKLSNFEKLAGAAKEASALLYEDELACIERLSRASKALKSAAAIDPKLEALAQELAGAEISTGEVGRSLGRYLDSLEFSPSRLDEIESRLNVIGRMKKKYARSVPEILEFGIELKAKLSSVEEGSEKEEELRSRIEKKAGELTQDSQLLVEKRRLAAKKLEKEVERELGGLGMKGTRFVVEIELQEEEPFDIELLGKKLRVNQQGPGQVQFLISPNVGEELRQLVRIASGGEVSRIMLALKTVLVQADEVNVMVFDEIDVGIGGKIARVVGEKLKALSKAKQIICITHIPMIACLGDAHFVVSKEVEGGRTYASVKRLNREERIKELARMLAGDKVSETTLKQAKEMLGPQTRPEKERASSSARKCARSSAG